MTHIFKRAFAILSLAIFGSLMLYNCEPDPDSLGEQLFLDGAAQGNEKSFDVIAYNIDNHDTIRTDATKMGAGVLGVFNEGQFGRQRASYLTQLRLSTYDPDFGANAAVDSVVLVIKPTYAADTVTTTTDDNYVYPDGSVAAKKVVNTYPVNKYGNVSTAKMTIKVNEVPDFLNGPTDIAYSNIPISPGTELGSKEFFGKVNSVAITRDSDASSIFTSPVGIRIPLSASFFKTKIIDKKDQPELQDASNFIRYFKGLRISVAEDDGYLMQFSPNDTELIMYYKYDKTDNGTTTRTAATYTFDLGVANSHIGQYQYESTGTPSQIAIGASNPDTGDARLYTQGMGGASIGIKIPDETITKLKKLYQNDKAAIISAKIRIYTDDNATTALDKKYPKPTAFTIVQRYIDKTDNKEKFGFTSDLTDIAGSNNFAIYKAFNLDKDQAYYDFTVTKSVKDLVEKGEDPNKIFKYFKIDLGSFLTTTTGTLAGYQYTSRPFARDRAIFIGSNVPGNEKRVQLFVIYGTK